MTIQGLLSKIFKANQTPNNTVNWSGVNGLKSIQEDLVDTIRQRTFFTVPTTADLLNQGFSNAVLCYVQDNAFYRWEPNGIPNGTTIFPAIDGGVWVQETIGDTDGTVTSIGITAPAAFTVTNSPVTTSGVIDIAANGTASEYIKGDGTLGTLPTPTGGTVTNVSALTINSTGTDLSSTVANPTTTPVITLSVPTASAVNRGVLSPTDWSTFNNKQNAITLTTTGTSGAATLVGSTLNIPQYQSVITNPVTGTGTTNYLSKWTSSSSLNNSLIYDDGTNIGIGTTSPGYKLDVNGTARIQNNTKIGNTAFSDVSSNLIIGIDSGTNAARAAIANASNYQDCFFVNTSISSGNVNMWSFGQRFDTYFGNTSGSFQIVGGYVSNTGTVSPVGAGYRVPIIANPNGTVIIAGASNAVNGNVLIGTTTDAGYKLYVNGSGTFVGELRLTGNLAAGPNRNYIIGNNPDFEVTTNTVIKFRNWYNTGDVYFSLDYANGGRATIGGVSATGYRLATSGSVTTSSAVARGAYFNNTLVAAANNDVLVGLDVAPTFTNGAFTGLTNLGLRVTNGFRLFTGGAVPNQHYLEAISTSTSNAYVNLVRNASAAGTYAYYLNNGVAYLSVDNGTGETRLWANNGGYYLTFFSNGVEAMRIPTTRNVLINTTTDAGFKLDVNGTARIQNTLNMGTSTDFQISGTSVVNKGISRLVGNGNGLIFSENMQAAQIAFQFIGNGSTTGNSKAFLSTGGKSVFNINVGLGNPNTSNCDASVLLLDGIHNITSFTNTIIRGIYYNPTLTSLTGVISHRAIQTTTGDVLLGTTSGSVGIGVNTSINASAILDITSTTKGFLKPRMTTTQRNAIATPATGLEVYNTTTNTEDYYNGTTWVSLQTTTAATKSFGAWQEDTTQTAAASNIGYGIKFSTPDISGYGVNVINDPLGNATYIEMVNNGVYNIQFSLQLQNTNNQIEDVTIWIRKNGNTTLDDIPATAGFVSVPNSHGGTPGTIIAAWNYFVEAAAGDFFQLVWSTTNNTHVTLEYYPAGSPPPSAASAILTVNQVN